jgi:hypothetical protein
LIKLAYKLVEDAAAAIFKDESLLERRKPAARRIVTCLMPDREEILVKSRKTNPTPW